MSISPHWALLFGFYQPKFCLLLNPPPPHMHYVACLAIHIYLNLRVGVLKLIFVYFTWLQLLNVPSMAGEVLIFFLHILWVLGSSLCQKTGLPDWCISCFPPFLQEGGGIVF
jgi:hypothetical protein